MGLIWMMIAAAGAPAVEASAAAPESAPAAAERGVIAYPPAFFADVRPASAYDMILRVPGFTFDKGSTVRGLAGSGGNVLIDGQPPLAKNDTLEDILRRIPAGSVARVEVIRGGAQGIDMEGRTVLANVVRRQESGFRGVAQAYFDAVHDGRMLPGVRIEEQWTFSGGRTLELSQVLSTGHFPNDEYGDGGRIRYDATGRKLIDSRIDADSHGSRVGGTGAYATPFLGGRANLTASILINRGRWSSTTTISCLRTWNTRRHPTIADTMRQGFVSRGGWRRGWVSRRCCSSSFSPRISVRTSKDRD